MKSDAPAIAVTPAIPSPSPDLGNGTFRNPVICADYSDPDVIRVGDDYFLTASSFNCTPALPILQSQDLVNWTIINHAVKNLPHERYRQMQPGSGVWAPSIRYHAKRYWIVFPMVDEGIYVTTADHPTGTWSEPWLLLEGKGLIDPCPLWDDDGQAYLVYAYARSRSGIKHRLSVAPMAADASRLIGESRTAFEDPERHPTLEGPKFHKRNGYYYISAPAGGVATGWQVILRSKSPYGPYEDKIVLEQGSTAVNGPHQGAIVEGVDGRWWFVHFQDAGIYGRIVHTQPVRWENDWPLIGVDQDGNGVGEPVTIFDKPRSGCPTCVPQTSDEFDQPALGLQWQWQANHEDAWCSLTGRPGFLRLTAQPPSSSLTTAPGLLLQKFPARSFEIETRVELSPGLVGRAGLVVIGQSHAALVIDPAAAEVQFIVDDQVVAAVQTGTLVAEFKVTVADGGLCRFFYRTGGDWTSIGPVYQAVVGHWIGTKVGLFCSGRDGYADFEYFRVLNPIY